MKNGLVPCEICGNPTYEEEIIMGTKEFPDVCEECWLSYNKKKEPENNGSCVFCGNEIDFKLQLEGFILDKKPYFCSKTCSDNFNKIELPF